MAEQTIKIGIIGAGIWGRNHALVLATHPRQIIICDRDEGRARALADTYGCAWTTSLDELAASDVAAVTIATPDHLHREPALVMLRSGKHVLFEKPLATSVADALEMVEAAEQAGVRLMVDFHARWRPLFMGAKSYVEGIVKLTIFGCSTLGMWGMRSLRGGTNRMEWGYKPATSLRVQ